MKSSKYVVKDSIRHVTFKGGKHGLSGQATVTSPRRKSLPSVFK